MGDMQINFVTGKVMKATDMFCWKTERDFYRWQKGETFQLLLRDVDNRKEFNNEF